MTTTNASPFDQRIRIGALRVGALALIPLLMLTRPYFSEDGLFVELMEVFGLILIMAAVLGRFWSILYVGRHKNRSVVTDGPYSVTRNPLYFFSTLGAFGFGMMFGKVSLALLLGGAVLAILYATARREQAFLAARFGAEYAAYADRVPMFLPDPRLFVTAPTVTISADALRRNLLDAFVFLAAFPLAELSEALHAQTGLFAFALP